MFKNEWSYTTNPIICLLVWTGTTLPIQEKKGGESATWSCSRANAYIFMFMTFVYVFDVVTQLVSWLFLVNWFCSMNLVYCSHDFSLSC
jgi:hypothetical protein